MREKLSKVWFWVVLGVLLFGGWAWSYTEPPLQTVGTVIFFTAALSGVIGVLIKTPLRAARSVQQTRWWRKIPDSKILWWFGVLGLLVPAALTFWQLIKAGVDPKELLLTAVGGVLLLTPVSLVVAAVIAKVTREWTGAWKDLALGVGGLLLFYLGIYGAFTTSYVLVGKVAGIVGLVLAAATIVLPRFRPVFRGNESSTTGA